MKRILFAALIITMSLVFMACGTTLSLTITFDTNGGSAVQSITTDGKSEVIIPADPTKVGYTFDGWYLDDTTYNELFVENSLIDSPEIESFTVYAKWTVNQYIITFSVDGGSAVTAIEDDFGASVTAPTNPTKTGYTFGGWYSNSTLQTAYTFTTIPSGNITVYAKWTTNQYTITFNVNGGSAISPIEEDFGSSVTAPTSPTKTGYTFSGWYSDVAFTTAYTFTTMPAEDKTVYAKWTINDYTISFNSNEGTSVTSLNQDFNTAVTAPTSPTRTGYTFGGWYSDSGLTTAYTFTTMPALDITLYAKWLVNPYTITLVLDGGSGSSSILDDFGTAITTPVTEKTGYTFGGWYSDIALTTAYTFTTMPAENITIYAKWTINQYTIIFNVDGGSAVTAITQDYNTIVSSPSSPTKTGYTFGEWYSDIALTTAYTFTTMPAEDITIYSKWTINQYTITLNVDGGSAVTAITQDYGSAISTPVTTKTGYTFEGWYSDAVFSSAYTFTTTPAENITIYAKWTINMYSITFQDYDSTVIQNTVYSYGADISGHVLPSNPVRIGYTFDSWDTTLGLTMPAMDITIRATYTINQYTISFDSNGGSIVSSLTQDFNSSVVAPTSPLLTGYSFNGWYSDTGLTTTYTFTTMPAEDITLYGKWTINQYTISFDPNGGSSVSSINQDYASVVVAPDAPTKSGFEFAGWYENSELTDYYEFSTIPAEDITLYAAWGTAGLSFTLIEDSYSVTIGSAQSDGDIIIPMRHEGILVTIIGASAFSATSITSVIIPESVTDIGYMAFNYCPNLTSIILPSNLKSIDTYAFLDCTGLTSIMIPSSVVSIASGAFEGCANLERVYFETGIQLGILNAFVFRNCASLISIIIPASVTMIGDQFFTYTNSLVSIGVEEGNQFFASVDGVLFDKDMTTLLHYPSSKSDTSYSIPSGIEAISSDAFRNIIYLTDLTIPNSLLNIEYATFYEFGMLETITFEANSQLQSIGELAFNGANQLNGITIPNSVISIGDGAFYNATNMKYINFESGSQLTTIGNSAFVGKGVLDYIFIPSSVTSIGADAFYGCWELVIFVEADSLPAGWDPDWNSYECTVVWGTQEFGENADFRYVLLSNNTAIILGLSLTNLNTEIIIPGTIEGMTVTRIISKAFMYNDFIQSVFIPASVTTIDYKAFRRVTSLSVVEFGENSLLTFIGEEAFLGDYNITSFIFPDLLETIEASAFQELTLLTSVFIPISVTYMGNDVFAYDTALTINVEAASLPVGWNTNWNTTGIPVVWGAIPE